MVHGVLKSLSVFMVICHLFSMFSFCSDLGGLFSFFFYHHFFID